jgi:hypothetical protein
MTLPVVFTANGPSGYNLTKSLRFRNSANAYLNRTPASAGNRKTWTFSCWMKFRGAVSGQYPVIFMGGATTSDTGGLCLLVGQNGNVYVQGYSTNFIISNNLLRDPASWYHIVLAMDSTQATGSNRFKLYINGVEASYNTYNNLTQNTDYGVNQAALHTVGYQSAAFGNNYFDGYLTEINFVDGQQLTPSSFGSTNALTGVWQPIKYTGTYGTNGFYLPFTNTTSTTTLGYDFSGNSNNWTTNNLSLTTGSTYDSMTDVPTLTSATTANYAVLNPLALPQVRATSLTNGNLQMISNSGASYNSYANGTIYPTTGKFYAEFYPNTIGVTYCGISRFTDVNTPNSWNANSTYYVSTGEIQKDGTTIVTGASYTNGDVIGVAWDVTNATCAFYKNNTLQTTITGVTAGVYTFSICGYSSAVTSINFGQQGFAYTPPTGFKALNTYNLPTSTIVKGNTVMDATTFTGNASTNVITNAGSFKPDMVWLKSRSNANNHTLYDSIRGVNNLLYPNLTNAQASGSNQLTSFNSNGFTLGASENANDNAGELSVGWNFKAGGTAASNTSGTVTSQVSANTTGGFSIATFTIPASGTTFTVGHGLGVTPSFVMFHTVSGTSNWLCQHTSTGTQYIILNSTGAATTDSTIWNSAPTSSVVNFGTSFIGSYPSNTAVMYCWAPIAGYSAFGSYTGNGSSDGSFVYCGFRPKFLLIKSSTSGTASWFMYDTSRNTYNAATTPLQANTSDSELTGRDIDILSNGFKCRSSDANINTNSGTYIYMAFAENPFKNALAR